MTAPILVTGATGMLGTRVVQRLAERGSQVRVLSRRARASGENVEYVAGDLAKGTGLDEAVAGVDVIVHCASAQRGDATADPENGTPYMVPLSFL